MHDVAHDIHIRLENPLPIPITKGIFQIEGSGIKEPLILKVCIFILLGILFLIIKGLLCGCKRSIKDIYGNRNFISIA